MNVSSGRTPATAARRLRRVRDRRFPGPGPYLLGFERDPEKWGSGFPFDVPVIDQVHQLDLSAPVTLLAGENGAGKSTLVEAVAAAMGFLDEGGELERPGGSAGQPRPVLGAGGLKPITSNTKPRLGYFLRAESFFNVASFIGSDDRYAPDLSLYGDTPLHQQSHGQSFLALAANRFGGQGLFVLDEPEAALSAQSALALLAIIARAVREGAQFVIATHSPILLACPQARIYELDESGARLTDYDDLDAVRLTRGFLAAPDRYLRAILEAD
jgi:predicted ATPase